jgi:uridine kinase
MRRIVEEIRGDIEREAAQKDSFIVAIDGRCASGKTTVAAELARLLHANLIHMDDFFLRKEQRIPERLAIPGENIDHERFLEEVLIPLKSGKPFAYRPFSCTCQEFRHSISVTPTTITIVEGSYACHPKLRNYYDRRIFMTVHPEEQMHRLYMRDGDYAEVFRDKWIPLEELYIANCGVLDCCDRVYEMK